MAIDLIQLILAMGLSFILIALIIACANFISYFGRQRAKERAIRKSLTYEDFVVPLQHFILLRVLLDKREHASLSAFQFLCWTLLISFLYVTLWFLQLLIGGTGAPPPIPESILALMGISVVIPLASQGISSYKKHKPRGKGETYVGPDYASMLEEEGRPSLLRLQMFLWTLASLAIYTGLFFVSVNTAPDIPTLVNRGLPAIDTTLLFLMGLSAVGYLGNQAYSGKVEKAEEPAQPLEESFVITPSPVSPIITDTVVDGNGRVIVLGSGFGTRKETIMVDEVRIPDGAISRWEPVQIDFDMPETVSRGTKHNLRVIVGGETAVRQIPESGPAGAARTRDIDATILGDLWIDSANERSSARVPPIGYFIPEKWYHFCFEFDVPPGTPQWTGPSFQAHLFIDGMHVGTNTFLPGAGNGKNIGCFDHLFRGEGTHHLEIRGANTKSMDIEVKRPPGQ